MPTPQEKTTAIFLTDNEYKTVCKTLLEATGIQVPMNSVSVWNGVQDAFAAPIDLSRITVADEPEEAEDAGRSDG